MSTIDSPTKSLSYPNHTLERARRSLICSPFQLHLFETMGDQSVSISAIALDAGIQNSYSKRFLSELATENELLWLIQVGVLRREVDGQGITDSFRLTPLGRQIVEHYQGKGWGTPSWRDRFYNSFRRWLKPPI